MVKTAAEQRGWQHSDHAQLFDAVATIAAETGDEDIDRLLEGGQILHTNFYEGWYGTGRVERGTTRHRDLHRQAATVGQRVTASPVATATRLASTIRAVSNSAPNDHRKQRLGSGRVMRKVCQPQTISLRQAICLPHHRPSPDVLAHVTQGICTGDRSAQPHPAARGRITLGRTRANKSYNPTHQPGASPTG